MRSAMRRAPSSGRARSALPCSRSGPRGRKSAGPSSCRTRAPSWCFCCSTTAITLNLLRVFEVPAVDTVRLPQRQLRNGRTGGLRRDALRRAVPRCGAGHGAPASAAGSVAVFAALGLGLALPFVADRLRPPLRRRLPKPGPWMVAAAAHPCDPDGADGAWLPVAVVAARRRRRRCRSGLLRPLWSRLMLFAAGLDAAQGQADRLCGDARRTLRSRVPGVWAMPDRPAAMSRAVAGAEAWSEERVAAAARSRASRCSSISPPTGALPARPTRRPPSTGKRCRDAFKAAGVKVLPPTGPTAIRTSRASWKAGAAPGVPLYLWYAPGRSRRSCRRS